MSSDNKKRGLIKLVSIGWLRFIATPSKVIINKELIRFLILYIFVKK